MVYCFVAGLSRNEKNQKLNFSDVLWRLKEFVFVQRLLHGAVRDAGRSRLVVQFGEDASERKN